jgi:hypothetical protein
MNDSHDDNPTEKTNQNDTNNQSMPQNVFKAAVIGAVVGGAAVALASKANRDKIKTAVEDTEHKLKMKANTVQKSAEKITDSGKKQLADSLGKVQHKLTQSKK